MSDSGLQKLLTWLSPAFPVGTFAWSAGLESAIEEARVTDSTSLQNWIDGTLHHGSIHTDAIVLVAAHGAVGDGERLSELADLVVALTPSRERIAETTITGDAFVLAAAAWPSEVYARLPVPCPYPVAVGAIAAAHGVDLHQTLVAYLTAVVHGQISVVVRLVPLGQTDGLRVLAALEGAISTAAGAVAQLGLEDIGTIAYAADIAQMRHETLPTRIFRS